MNSRAQFFVVMVMAILLWHFQEEPSALAAELEGDKDQNPNSEFIVKIEITVLHSEDGRIQVSGTTNLPPKTELMFSLDNTLRGGFSGSAKGQVNIGGVFCSEKIGPPGGLPMGQYIAEVLMPLPDLQPASVQKIIGEKGEFLKGHLVEKDFLGIVVSKTQDVAIGGEQAVIAQKQIEKEQQESIKSAKHEMCKLLEELLSFVDSQNFAEYGFGVNGPYKSWQTRVDDLRDELTKKGSPIPLEIIVAATNLYQLGLQYIPGRRDTQYRNELQWDLQETIGYERYLENK